MEATGPVTRSVAVATAVGHGHVSHRPYVTAVSRALEAQDIAVGDVTVTVGAKGHRRATLALYPAPGAFNESVPDQAVTCWDEETGWSLSFPLDSPGSRFREGSEVLPEPGSVAAWLVVALTHPALASTDPGSDRFRDHRTNDPVFEARLASYTPGW